MKERPILFSGPMVRAILDGSKTMTRRIVKPQPAADSNLRDVRSAQADTLAPSFRCPFGVPGDRLWVRETWVESERFGVDGEDDAAVSVHYRADDLVSAPIRVSDDTWRDAGRRIERYQSTEAESWRPSIHMPRWASRIDLEVTGVRVERLQDITEEDAKAEGVDHVSIADVPRQAAWSCRQDFSVLWDKINGGKAPWKSNPWVWVVSFKRVRP